MKIIKRTFPIILAILVFIPFSSCEKDEEDPFKDDLEPNNNKNEAYQYTLGEQIDASISKGDHDWYSFSVNTNWMVDIARIEVSNLTTELTLTTVLYDSLGNQFGSFTGNMGNNVNINLSTRTSSYLLEIYDQNSEQEGDYQLTVNLLDANDSNEPDDTFDNSYVINSYPSGNISGTILVDASDSNQYGDFEFFTVLINANKKVDFTLTPSAGDIKMNYKIYNEDRTVAVNETEGSEGQILEASVGSGTGGSMSRYLRVGATLGDSGNGNYTISFTETDI